ncbi:MAG: DNA-3-methyladenine glycosylase family protein [Gemmatimonadaceae bacterium]
MTRTAVARLKRADPVLRGVIEAVGPCRYAPRAEGSHFDALLRAILYQQLSGKAAATIHGRMRAIYGDRDPLPAELLATADESLRAAGVSRQKLGYLRDLATHVADGLLPLDEIELMDDEAAIAALVGVRGIGRWSAQMFLMFRLGRPDVVPELDLGVQKGIQLAYGLDTLPAPRDVLRIAEPWAPYRTVASWYLWRSLD